jgi:hypothetical protein
MLTSGIGTNSPFAALQRFRPLFGAFSAVAQGQAGSVLLTIPTSTRALGESTGARPSG